MQTKIIEQMKKRDYISKEFIRTFGNFVKAYEEYISWMHKVKKIQGQYHNEESFSEYCKKNIDLIEDIKKNGIKEKIILGEDELGIDVLDGFHRLVIAEIWNKEIKF